MMVGKDSVARQVGWMDRLLILSVCALLLCLWMPFLVITSAPSFHGSSHDLWLVFSFVSPCLLCLCS